VTNSQKVIIFVEMGNKELALTRKNWLLLYYQVEVKLRRNCTQAAVFWLFTRSSSIMSKNGI